MKTTYIFCVVLLIVAVSNVAAGSGTIKIDLIQCKGYEPYSYFTGGDVRFVIRYINDIGERVGVINDFVIKTYDGAGYWGVSIDTLVDASQQSPFAAYFNQMFALSWYIGSPYDAKLSVMGSGDPSHGLPVGFSDTVLAITAYSTPAFDAGKHLCIDTTSPIPYERTWKWFTASAVEVSPEFVGIDPSQPYIPGYGYCFVGVAPCTPPVPAKTAPMHIACGCGSCCQGTTGNVNMQGEVDLSDLAILIAYMTQTPKPTLACQEEANVDVSGGIDLSDLSRLIAHLTVTPRPSLPACP